MIKIHLPGGVEILLPDVEAERIVKSIQGQLALTDPWSEIASLWHSGDRVGAIKMHRSIFSSGLKAALDEVRGRFEGARP